MTMIESQMLAKESQTNRVIESDSFSSKMTLLRDRLTLFLFSVRIRKMPADKGGRIYWELSYNHT